MISVAPAIGNAIQHATGAELMHMPIRHEDVWRALQNREPIDNWITETPVGSCRSDLPGGNVAIAESAPPLREEQPVLH